MLRYGMLGIQTIANTGITTHSSSFVACDSMEYTSETAKTLWHLNAIECFGTSIFPVGVDTTLIYFTYFAMIIYIHSFIHSLVRMFVFFIEGADQTV